MTTTTTTFISVVSSVKSNLRKFTEYIHKKSTKNKWQSGLIGGTLLYFTTRYLYNKLYRKYYSLPPGPEGYVPAIGVILTTILNPTWHISMAMTYGQIMSFYQFNTLRVIINDSFIAKQVLQNALDRPQRFKDPNIWRPVAAADNTPSFLAFNGTKWSTMRRAMHSKLIRILNTKYVNDIINEFMKNKLEPKLKEIILNNDGLWYSNSLLGQLTFNVIFKANFGESVASKKNDKIYNELAKDLGDILGWNIAKRVAILFLFPKLSHVVIPKSWFEPAYDLRQRINDNIKLMIQQKNTHASGYDEDNKTFMEHISDLAEKNNDYTASQEIADNFLMFLAGTDTTAISLEWGLILLAKQYDIQNKVRNELQTVLSKNDINYRDASAILYDIDLLLQVPLFRALIHEILRISCVARLGVTHEITQKDMWITTKDNKKYRLPKGCHIDYNVEYINYNNKIGCNENWKNRNKNPQEIYLKNWLNDGKFEPNPSFLTFGFGKRDCIGKQLAMKELRIVLGYLLLNYKFSLESKYKNMTRIPCKGGKGPSVAKPFPEMPVIVELIDYKT